MFISIAISYMYVSKSCNFHFIKTGHNGEHQSTSLKLIVSSMQNIFLMIILLNETCCLIMYVKLIKQLLFMFWFGASFE